MFVELMDKRKKNFTRLRAEEQRIKPPTKAQKRSQMYTYLKHMAGYKQNQLKSKNYDEIQKLFDKAMTRVIMFVDMDTESLKKAEMIQESRSKRTREELESDNSKKQKIDENVEAKVDDEAEMKKIMEIVPDDENINKEDLETLWKLVKAIHENTRLEEAYERVLWGDLKVMFETDVEKKNYALTPATITKMLNEKLQTDHWNEMCYQLLKLMTKQRKNPGSERIVGIKRLHDDLEVNTAKVRVTAAKHNLVLLVILVKNMLSKRMTKVIRGEFEKIKDVKVEDVSLTYDTPLEFFNNEHEADNGMGYDPSDVAFTEWYEVLFIRGGRYEILFIRGGKYEVAGNVRWQYEVGATGQSEHDTCLKRVIRGCQACVSPRLSYGDPKQ
ncbi:hypothetical protein Tco_1209897 [Tanacetum coccineum]